MRRRLRAFVFNFAQTSQHQRTRDSTRGNGELLVNDARRYRLNAAECLSAAERCQLSYRRLAFTIAAYWLALARQQKAVDELLANCSTLPSASSDVHPMYGRGAVKAYILAPTLGFALAGTGSCSPGSYPPRWPPASTEAAEKFVMPWRSDGGAWRRGVAGIGGWSSS
jgi:hypothetical protein